MLYLVKVSRVLARLGLRSGFQVVVQRLFVASLFCVGLAACSVSALRARPDTGMDGIGGASQSNDAAEAGHGGQAGNVASGGAGGPAAGTGGGLPDAGSSDGGNDALGRSDAADAADAAADARGEAPAPVC